MGSKNNRIKVLVAKELSKVVDYIFEYGITVEALDEMKKPMTEQNKDVFL